MGTQNEVAERYGPQTAQIEALLERAHNLSGDETEALRDAARAAGRAASRAAWDAAWDADRAAARVAARAAAWDAAGTAGDGWVVRRTARSAWYGWASAWDAVLALVIRDLIGQHGFTQEHYDAMVGPWESVMGTEWTRETL